MNGRVLANAAVFVLGLVLIIGGAWGIWRGSDYIQLERGWASVISGAVAATGGVLTLAVGFVLRRLDALHSALLTAGARGFMLPSEAPVVAQLAEAMPLGLEPAPAIHPPEPQVRSYESEAAMPEPKPAAIDPGVLAAAAINVELLAHEARHMDGEQHPHYDEMRHPDVAPAEIAPADAGVIKPPSAEAAPEIVRTAERSQADEMVKAAGVSDEPELDAAIEELLAEERGPRPSQPAAEEPAPASPAKAAPEMHVPPADAQEAVQTAPQRAGWRGLFSRKERRTAPPVPAETTDAAEPASEDEMARTNVAAEPEAAPEEIAAETAPLHAHTIPRTGDDWFDRALSGLDEVETTYAPSRPGYVGDAADTTDHAEDTGSRLEVHPPLRQEPPSGAPAAEPAVIGRYTSGNTTYVMFADGSIEAETPTGILHFASLADLKVYVEGGSS
jgi:hypothetical protein